MKKLWKKCLAGSLVMAMAASELNGGSMGIFLQEAEKIYAKNSVTEEAPESDFTFDSATGTITAYVGDEAANLIVPSTIQGVQVKHIGQQAFDGLLQPNVNFKQVVFPDGLESIGAAAFYAMAGRLESVYIPASVTEIAPRTSGFYPFPGETIIYGEAGSYAESWAGENGFTFIPDMLDLEGTVYFEKEKITIPLGAPTQIKLYVPEKYEGQIEWSIQNRKLTSSDTTEYLSWVDEDSNSSTRVIKGNAAMKLTPYNSDPTAGYVTAKIKDTNKSVTMAITVDASGDVTGADIRDNDGNSVAFQTITLVEEETITLTGVSCPEGTNAEITYSSTDTKVAKVGKYGSVTAVGEGKATIKAQCKNGGNTYTASCIIRVVGLKEYKDYIKYVENEDGTITLRSCETNIAGGFEVPEEINGKKVTALYDYCFCSCKNLESVTIPSSVTKIADNAFNVTGWGNNTLMPIIIVGTPGSYAETYANEKGLEFKDVKTYTPATTAPKPTAKPTPVPTATILPGETAPAEPEETATVETEETAPAEPEETAPAKPQQTATVTPSQTPTAKPSQSPTVTPSQTPTATPAQTANPQQTPMATQKPGSAGWELETPAPTVKKASISWSKKVTKLKVGKKYTFKVKKTNTSSKLTWSVSDKKKASITQKGVFTAKKKGKVKVTVKCGQLKKSVTVTIKK